MPDREQLQVKVSNFVGPKKKKKAQQLSETQKAVAMASSPVQQSCLRQLNRKSLGRAKLPISLAGPFSRPLQAHSFSSTSPTQSRIGRAPISVPPEVSLNFIDLPQVHTRRRDVEIPKTEIEINGPLGGFAYHSFCLSAEHFFLNF